MVGYIYKITNPKGRIYIGQTIRLEARISAYKNCYCIKQIRLYNSIKKYGWENHKFDVIKIGLLEELNILERYFQEIYDVLGRKGLNCRLTATDDLCGRMRRESIEKSQNKRKKIKFSEETKLKMSISRTGKKYTSKQIYNTITKVIYKSVREAALDIGVNKQTLTNMLNGRQKNKYPYLEVLPRS